jgi:BirA family biotin operon repressor/biotin-[acetyl-CoA-carboxylase] ligase
LTTPGLEAHQAAGQATARPFPSRLERFEAVPSTNDIVREWLAAGTPEVCLARADHQTRGRGRDGRTWTTPPGRHTALLMSLGFRPTYLEPDRAWRLAAIVSLAMADAAEDVAGLPDGTVRLKWPNDLVVEVAGPWAPLRGEVTAEQAARVRESAVDVRKLGGVLGETEGLGTADPRVIVGIGVNADWRRTEFPPELAGPNGMTSLHDASGGRPIDTDALLDAFLTRLEVRHDLLVRGRFDAADWADRQLTNGRPVRLERPDGTAEVVRALGVDALTGALVVEGRDGDERHVVTGEIRHVRAADAPAAAAGAPLPTDSPLPTDGQV